MIVIAAIIKVIDGKGDEAEQIFKKLVPKVLKDPGTIAYVAHRSTDDPSKFFFYEKYEDMEAVKYHGSTPHFKECIQALTPLQEGPTDAGLYRQIE